MRGPFVFDDLSFSSRSAPLAFWLHSLRPVLMASYWINTQISGDSTYSFHILNVVIHCLATIAIFFIVRRLLESSGAEAGRRDGLAAFTALLFLLHPVQTESVAYLAGRSESLSDALAFFAFGVFLCRPKPAITWLRAASVLVLFVAALLTKEQTMVLPVLFLLTDWYWNPGFSFRGIRNNWRLYLPMGLATLGGAVFFWDTITRASSAGFGLRDFTWYQYFFTQCRALFVYLGMFLLPVNLTADWDFPVSRTLWEHGAILGLTGLLLLAGAAWHYRRRYPLASYGYFVFLLLMAPTSSILPIRDPIAERRLYFGMLGLLLILADGLNRLKKHRNALVAGCALVLFVAAGVTHSRARVWSDATLLWEDTVQHSGNKARPHFQLGNAYYHEGHCDLAVSEFQKAARLESPSYALLVDWAIAYDCLERPEEAVAKLRQAAAISPTAHVYSQIGMIYAKRARWVEALSALATAEELDPRYFMIYYYEGGVHLSLNQSQAAVTDYEHALALNPDYAPAQQGLSMAQSRLRFGR
jgi:tetratricopeptide (TPR) repeat protein